MVTNILFLIAHSNFNLCLTYTFFLNPIKLHFIMTFKLFYENYNTIKKHAISSNYWRFPLTCLSDLWRVQSIRHLNTYSLLDVTNLKSLTNAIVEDNDRYLVSVVDIVNKIAWNCVSNVTCECFSVLSILCKGNREEVQCFVLFCFFLSSLNVS